MSPLPLKKPIYFVVGGCGSGKSTQCEMLKRKYGFSHISTGDLLRADARMGSVISSKSLAGQLVPIEDLMVIYKSAIQKELDQGNGTRGILIDGFPCDLNDGRLFEKEIGECTMVFYFEVSPETLMQRCLNRGKKSGRIDDNERSIGKRLELFTRNNGEILEYYKNKGKLLTFSAQRPKDELFNEVCTVFDRMH